MSKSFELYRRAQKVIAGGHFSNFKQSPGGVPVFMERVEGSHLYSVDGQEYLDFSLSSGPCILGQSSPVIQEAITEQLKKCYSRQYMELQIEAAELLCQYIPCADQIHFSVSGGESILYCLRLARAYTGKNMIIRYTGTYNGGTDVVLGGQPGAENYKGQIGYSPEDDYGKSCHTTGRAKHALDDCYMLELNDMEQLETVFRWDSDIAAVIMEPVCLNISGCVVEKPYMHRVRELCDQYGALLIFDETLTGFRMGLNGAQGYYDVLPDIASYAKAICGGIPGAAFGGRKEVMDKLADCTCIAPGTYNGNALIAAAIKAVVTELAKNDGEIYRRFEKLGGMFYDGVMEAAKRHGVPMILQGFPAAWFPVFTEKDCIRNHKEALLYSDIRRMQRFGDLMKENGVIGDDRYCLSAAHTEEDIQKAIMAADRSLQAIREEME